MATQAVEAELGSHAPDFALPGACGQIWSRPDALGPNGLAMRQVALGGPVPARQTPSVGCAIK